jgi:purine-binding chemotaxis protein CheW
MSRRDGFGKKGTAPEEGVQLLTFQLGDQEYGLPIDDVVQVVRMVAITRAPKAPPVVAGMLNLRGKVIPVVDLRERFDLPSRPCGLNDHLLIAQSEGRTMALIVDLVNAVRLLSAESIDRAAGNGSGMTDYLAAVGKLSDRLLLILDLKKVLTFEEERRLEQILADLGATLNAENGNRFEKAITGAALP